MATTIKPTLAETPEVRVQIRQEIAATAKIERAELISYNVAGVITFINSAKSFRFEQSGKSKPPAPNLRLYHQPRGPGRSVDHHE
jgi:hypothetical protein